MQKLFTKSLLVLFTLLLTFSCDMSSGVESDGEFPFVEGCIEKTFWGNWVRMDGVNEEWYFSDSQIRIEDTYYNASASSDEEISVPGIEIMIKTENMLTIRPDDGQEFYLFRKSGATALVNGGVLGSSAVSSISKGIGFQGIGGIQVILTNLTNHSNTTEATTDSEGDLIFDEVIPMDEYSLQIPEQDGVDEDIAVTVTPEFDGDNLGFVTLNDAAQNFKVSSSLSGGSWGYYYAENTYNISIIITNHGTIDMFSANYEIDIPAGMSVTGNSLKDILGTVQADGGTKELQYSICVDGFYEEYRDYDIPILIYSVDGNQWSDLIQLRFYRESMSINVRSESSEVQGIVISPDNISHAFQTSEYSGSIIVPARDSAYILALSGANYNSETKYVIKINEAPLGNGSTLTNSTVNEPNNDETLGTPMYLRSEEMAFLGVYDLDFYDVFNDLHPARPTVTGICLTSDSTPTWSWYEMDGVSEYRYSFEDGPDWTSTSALSYTPPADLPDGSYELFVQARILPGTWSESGSYIIDIVNIGNIYGGGIVFYLDGTGGGLISALTDQSSNIAWRGYKHDIGTSMEIGSGAANTTAIVNRLGDEDCAAKLCSDLILGGYADWFLPSIDELNLMYESQALIGGFSGGSYWSSSEGAIRYAWHQDFSSGRQGEKVRFEDDYVRAIRSF